MTSHRLIIVGQGGLAREIHEWNRYSEMLLSAQINDDHWDRPFVVAIGDPELRAKVYSDMCDLGLKPSKPLIHGTAYVGRDVHIKPGSIICPNCSLTTNILINENCIVNLNCTVGHDCVIASHVTISPGVNISGNVTIGQHVFIGIGASIREKLTISSCVTIGMGAVLTKNALTSGGTYVGVPARLRNQTNNRDYSGILYP
jgi:sugar O-acyltransferase (sialic acid O-acetyltransferase NeuD family)